MHKILHLQALRAIAASLVVVAHAIEYMIRRKAFGEESHFLAGSLGWLGVGTFFVISGLILIRSSINNFGAPGAATDFAVRRVVRIGPLYWFATGVFAVGILVKGEPLFFGEVLKSLFFIPYFSGQAMRPIAGQGWTLNYEMFFYLVFCGCLLLRKRLGVAMLVLAMPFAVAIGLLIRPLIPYDDPKTAFEFWTDPITLFFSLGVILGLIENKFGRLAVTLHPMMISLALFLTSALIFSNAKVHFPLQLGWQAFFLVVSAFAVFLCTSTRLVGSGKIGQILVSAGDASYSTYILHPLVLIVLAAFWDRLPAGLKFPIPFLCVSVIAANMVGYLSFRFLERPTTLALLRFVKSKSRFESKFSSNQA